MNMKKVKLLGTIGALTLIAGCVSLGPLDSPNLGELALQAVGEDHDRSVLLVGPGSWQPNTRGFTAFRNGSGAYELGSMGVIALTDQSLVFSQWEPQGKLYQPMLRIPFAKVNIVSFDTFGMGRAVVVQLDDYTTHTFSMTQGLLISAERTERLFDILKAKIPSES